MLFTALVKPAELFIGRRDGEEFDTVEESVNLWRRRSAEILDKQMQEMSGILPKASATRFRQHHAVVHEKQSSACQRLNLMHEDLAAVEHGGHFDLIPFTLSL